MMHSSFLVTPLQVWNGTDNLSAEIVGVMIEWLASRAVNRGFDPQSGRQTKL